MKRKGNNIDYVSIASPNYLHDSHIRFALKNGAHAICEKPLVLNPWNVDGLQIVEKETGLEDVVLQDPNFANFSQDTRGLLIDKEYNVTY